MIMSKVLRLCSYERTTNRAYFDLRGSGKPFFTVKFETGTLRPGGPRDRGKTGEFILTLAKKRTKIFIFCLCVGFYINSTFIVRVGANSIGLYDFYEFSFPISSKLKAKQFQN